MSYYCIWIDDERPAPETAIKYKGFDVSATTTNKARDIIRKKYRAGIRYFMLDIDNDTPDALLNKEGGEFYNVLDYIDYMSKIGMYRDCEFLIRIHTGNGAARDRMRNIIEHNKYMKEIL